MCVDRSCADMPVNEKIVQTRAGEPAASGPHRGHFWLAQRGQFWRAPKEPVATEVELVAADGARLMIRFEGREGLGLDVTGLARAFWSREG